MQLVSTTLTANCEGIIGDALAGVVDWVDACLVIDTGVTDRTLEVAREVAKEKLLVRRFEWLNDFAAARNFSLDAAYEAGANWAVTVDTDERLALNGLAIGKVLENATEGVLMVEDEGHTYAKERLFRLPAKERWQGPTHEAFPSWKGGVRTLPQATFRELPKSREAAVEKFQRDVEILTEHVRLHPDDPRWHYYLGESHKHLEQYPEAIAAYEACAALRGWREEGAWACYRAAECHVAMGAFEPALVSCAQGLGRHAGLAELCWLAGFCAHQLGEHEQAVCWSQMAIAQGWYRGTGRTVQRIGFRHPPGLYEGPYDVLRFALRALGRETEATEAERHFQLARADRAGRAAGGPPDAGKSRKSNQRLRRPKKSRR